MVETRRKALKGLYKLFVNVISRVLDVSVEAPLVGVVIDSSDVAIGFHQRVLSSDNLSVALFSLVLDVPGCGVVDSIFEGVLGVRVGIDTVILLWIKVG